MSSRSMPTWVSPGTAARVLLIGLIVAAIAASLQAGFSSGGRAGAGTVGPNIRGAAQDGPRSDRTMGPMEERSAPPGAAPMVGSPDPSPAGRTATGPTSTAPTPSGPTPSGPAGPSATGPVGGSTSGRAPSRAVPTPAKVTYPQAGHRTWTMAAGHSEVAGRRGRLLRYRVAVEKGITGITAHELAVRVVATLSDRRSWIGTGKVRLQRVPGTAAHDFTIYLATPGTRAVSCGDAPVRTSRRRPDRYTSCRSGDRVVLNVARWVHGVPDYGSSLASYQTYMINHETGHRLGHGHELCPGRGRPAPVMQQQTLGLHGCTANAWPRLKGKLYRGPAGEYPDPIPGT